MPEIKEMLSIVLHDLGFSTAVVHQVCLCLQSPSIFLIFLPCNLYPSYFDFSFEMGIAFVTVWCAIISSPFLSLLVSL
jgi:hypothetical protein